MEEQSTASQTHSCTAEKAQKKDRLAAVFPKTDQMF
jgi:hypothetical protein